MEHITITDPMWAILGLQIIAWMQYLIRYITAATASWLHRNIFFISYNKSYRCHLCIIIRDLFIIISVNLSVGRKCTTCWDLKAWTCEHPNHSAFITLFPVTDQLELRWFLKCSTNVFDMLQWDLNVDVDKPEGVTPSLLCGSHKSQGYCRGALDCALLCWGLLLHLQNDDKLAHLNNVI